MSKRLEGKTAAVTGASSGIGLAIAKAFALEGARVFISGRDQAALDIAVAEIGHSAQGIKADASRLTEIDEFYAGIKAQGGSIDVLVLNAGVFEPAMIEDVTEEHFDKLYATNVRGVVFGFQKAIPLLAKGSSAIIVGSIGGFIGIPGMSIYGSTKAAIRALVRGWILDLKGRGIRINVLAPGHISTPGLNKLLTDEQRTGLISTIPLARLGEAEDVAKAAVFLATDESAYINGAEVDVDGGVAQY